MSLASRERLARLVRQPGADLAEAALLIGVELDPSVDVDVSLLRLDALADGLRSQGFESLEPRHDAAAIASYLADEHGFRGNEADYYDPANAFLHKVLDDHRGLPITLSILFVAIARRLRVPAFGIGLPGHFVAGVGGKDRPVVVDPFGGGRILTESEMAEQVRAATSGRIEFTRSMLRPAPAPLVVRRILNNLTRDFSDRGDWRNALWTVELKRLLPSTLPRDLRTLGEVLVHLGSFGRAADAFDAYVEATNDAPDRDEVRQLAIQTRARMN